VAGGVLAGIAVFLRQLFGEQGTEREVPDVDGIAGLNREQLYERAKQLDIEGRSKMNKSQLQQAIARREAGGAPSP
jgi:hypothetical protein